MWIYSGVRKMDLVNVSLVYELDNFKLEENGKIRYGV